MPVTSCFASGLSRAISEAMTQQQPTPSSDETTLSEAYSRPTFEVICLDCEISSYAPDGDDRPRF